MPYSISTGDFVEVQLVTTLYAQTCRNVFHYRKEDGASISDGDAYLSSFLDYWDATIWQALAGNLSTDLKLKALTAQVVKPNRYRVRKQTSTVTAGTVPQPSTPPSSTFNFQRYAQRSGRKYQGRVYIPGCPQDSVLAGQLTDDAKDALLTTEVALEGPHVVSGITWGEYLNVEGTDVLLQRVIGYTLDPILRSQRRREIGVGE